MAKKNFKKGFGDLFDDALEGNFNEAKEVRTKKTTKSQKSFASDLDIFLQDAIEGSIKEQAAEVKKAPAKPRKPKRSKRIKPKFGLDSLIQQTVETSQIEAVVDGEVKRVTFIFDKTKLEKLKKIARVEKAYVKDIVDELVSQYIEKHDITKA